jgi:hypothetical protein
MEEIHSTYSNSNRENDNINVLWIEAGGLIANFDEAANTLRRAPHGLLVGATSDTIGHHHEV